MVSELNDKVLGELPQIIEDEGITSLKVFMAYKNTFQADDGVPDNRLTRRDPRQRRAGFRNRDSVC
jgi:hypothetical protein